MKKNLYLIVVILIFNCVFCELSASVWYVTSTGNGSGSSWADASSDLQLIMNNSSSGDEIWVANGTYKPNRRADNLGVINMGDRYNAFVLKSDVKIYGGFAGTETSLSQRNWISNVTILSGDIGAAGDNIDNAYHVVVSAGAVGAAELNGFTITGGNSNGDVTSITVNLKAVTRESAGGIYCSNSSPILTNLIISNNYANFGGGIYNSFSSPIITKSTIKNNTAGNSGGGICNTGFDSTTKSSPILKNVLIYGNTATTNGGGIFDDSYTNTNFVNITLTKNSVTNGAGGGYYNFTSVKATPIIQNSIIWGNIKASAVNNVSTNAATVYNYSLVQGGSVNMTNIISNYNPQFTDSIANNFTLKAGSPAINAGFNSYISDVSSDLLEKSRVYNGLVDLGVYESEIAPTPIQIFGANLIADTTGFYNLRSLFVALWAYGSQSGKDIVVKINASTDETTPAYPTLSSRSWKSLTFYPTVSGCVIRGLYHYLLYFSPN